MRRASIPESTDDLNGIKRIALLVLYFIKQMRNMAMRDGIN
jgi:hypothetical protein